MIQQEQQQYSPSTNPSNRISNRTPLRRAVYIKVADLTSTYNINPTLLEEELARVNAERENLLSEEKSERFFGGIPAELDTSVKKRLQPPRGGNNMVLLVGKVRIVVDKYRVDASRVRLAVVEVGDESGCVSLRARDEQIDTLLEIANRSGAVVLRNCTLELYQGKHIRLAVTKWGKISAYPDHVYSTPSPPNSINYERNFSMINLSLIASDTMASQSTDQSKTNSQYHTGDNTSQGNFTNPSNQGVSINQQRHDRRPSRNTAIQGLPLHSYQNTNAQQNTSPQYSGQQQYTGGFVADVMSGPQYYTPQRQSDVSVQQQQQQIMYQQHRHQYELQQHQMHMYHQSPLLESHEGSMQFTLPLPFQNAVVGGTNFQVTYSPQSSAAAGHHQQQFHGSHIPQQQQQQQQQQFVPLQQIPPSGSHNGMNAQAATYAPNISSHDDHPTP